MDGYFKTDRDRFVNALKAIGVDTNGTIEPVRALSKRFEDELSLKLAAAEVGLTEKQFLELMDRSPVISKALGSLRVATLKRDLFIKEFRNIVTEFNLGLIFSGKEINDPRLNNLPLSADNSTATTEGLSSDANELVLNLGTNVNLEMVLIRAPKQKFIMGSPGEEAGHRHDEDQQSVELKYSYYMGKFEVTQKQYEAVVGKTRNRSVFRGDDRPVENVTWDEAVYFCKCVRDKTQKNVRLPNEVEWEFACRACTTTPFYFGSTINSVDANYDGSAAPFGNGVVGSNRRETTPIGRFKPNPFGLYGMHDNVSEWCEVYDPNHGEVRSETADLQADRFPVIRGGSWHSRPENCRSAWRESPKSETKRSSLGFRIVVSK